MIKLFRWLRKPRANPVATPTISPLSQVVDYPHLSVSPVAIELPPIRLIFKPDAPTTDQPTTANSPNRANAYDDPYATLDEAKRIYRQAVKNVLINKLRSH